MKECQNKHNSKHKRTPHLTNFGRFRFVCPLDNTKRQLPAAFGTNEFTWLGHQSHFVDMIQDCQPYLSFRNSWNNPTRLHSFSITYTSFRHSSVHMQGQPTSNFFCIFSNTMTINVPDHFRDAEGNHNEHQTYENQYFIFNMQQIKNYCE